MLDLDDIVEVAVFPVPHKTLGEDVAALVVMQAGSTLTEIDLKAILSELLDFEHCPKFLFFVDSLPKQASSGKVSRTAIAKEYADQVTAPLAPNPVASDSDAVASQIAHIAASILGLDHIGIATSLFAIGLTSLDTFRLCAQVQHQLQLEISPADVLRLSTCADLARHVTGATAAVPLRDDPTQNVSPLLRAIAARQHVSTDPLRNVATLLLTVPAEITQSALVAAWDQVIAANPILRAKPMLSGQDVSIEITATQIPIMARETQMRAQDLRDDPAGLHELLSPQDGVMVAAYFVHCAQNTRCLAFVINQFLADGYAHHILVRQLNAALTGAVLETTEIPHDLCQGAIDPAAHVPKDTLAPFETGAVPDFDMLRVDLPIGLWARMGEVAKSEAVTPFSIGLAAFSHILERLTGDAFPVWFATQKRRTADDFMTIANATRPQFVQSQAKDASLVGYANALLSGVLTGDWRLEAVPHRDSTPCWFEIADEAENLSRIIGTVPGPLDVLLHHSVDPGQAGLELSLYPATLDHSGHVSLKYDRNLMSPDKASALLDGFTCLLQGGLDAPSARLSSIASCQHEVSLPAWPVTRAAHYKDVYADFLRQCDLTPETNAIVSDTTNFSFAELKQVVQTLSGLMRRETGDTPLRVAAIAAQGAPAVQSQICVLAAFLAARATDSIFMPVGAQATSTQCQADLNDLGIDLIFGALDDPRIQDMGDPAALELPQLSQITTTRLSTQQRPQLPDVTQIIYSSSGTTGPQKKICVSADRFTDYFNGLHQGDLIAAAPSLAGANVSFDVWMYDVLFAVLSGHAAIFVPQQRRTCDILAKAAELGAQNLSLTPSVAASALAEDSSVFQQFRTLYLIGEALNANLRVALCKGSPDTNLVNCYGTTETSISATLQKLHVEEGGIVRLGAAIPGFEVFILDRVTLQQQMAGWPGEVVIIQPSSRSTYLSDKMAKALNLQLYDGRIVQRTGDVGVITKQGDLTLVGRIDRQVQINGTRIELNAVEDIAETINGVAASAALYTQASARIQLYVVLAQTADPDVTIAQMRQSLVDHLPRAVQNLDVFEVSKIPLGPTGKKRRDLLVQQDVLQTPTKTARRRDAIPPGAITDTFARLWESVLPKDPARQLTPQSNFFDEGGTSLDMLRLAGVIAKELKTDVAEELLFANPALEKQARAIAGQLKVASKLPHGTQAVLISDPRTANANIRIVALPSLFGETSIGGNFTALGIDGVCVWGMRPAQIGTNLISTDAWVGMVSDIADWILATDTGQETILLGYSMGGWMCWAINLELQGRGHKSIRAISFDGPVNQLRSNRSLVRAFIETTKAKCPHYQPCDMLLFHRITSNNIQQLPHHGEAWAQTEEINLQTVALPTIDHIDLARPKVLRAQKPILEAFINHNDIGKPPPSEYIDFLGFRMYALMSRPTPPSEVEVRDLIAQFDINFVADSLGSGLICLALATGNPEIVAKAVHEVKKSQSLIANKKVVRRALVFVRLALEKMDAETATKAEILAEYENDLSASFLAYAAKKTDKVQNLRPIWHDDRSGPIHSQDWIERSFKFKKPMFTLKRYRRLYHFLARPLTK